MTRYPSRGFPFVYCLGRPDQIDAIVTLLVPNVAATLDTNCDGITETNSVAPATSLDGHIAKVSCAVPDQIDTIIPLAVPDALIVGNIPQSQTASWHHLT